jgi:serine/threonine protein kinase
MTEPSRSAPGTDNTEIEPRESLDPTLARPGGDFVLPTRKVEPEPNFAPPEKPGEVGTLGRYRVLKKLGRGGMGAVYLTYDTVLARRIALKVMLPQHAVDTEARERFLREARAAAAVSSDHVVTIFDVDEKQGVPFIAMEYLLGYPLDQYLRVNGELPLAQIFRIGRETALGLTAAHELGLVHRDVKPGNLWLEAPHGRVKLLDFGLARAQNDETHLTTSGLVVGTPAFMSPEQARGWKLDGRSDLFSLGVMLFRLATGKMPFNGTTTMAVLTSLAVDIPPLARQLKADVPEALEAIIAKLLAKDPAERYQTAWEVAEALRAAELPRPVMGAMPVVIPVVPMAIPVQSENVWEAIEASGSSPQVLESGTMAESAAVPVSRKKPERKPSMLPAILAGVGLLLAVGVLVAVLSSKKEKGKDKELVIPTPGNEKRSPVVKPPGPPVATADRKAAEWVLAAGGEVRVTVGGKEIALKQPAGLPNERFTLTGFTLTGKQIISTDMERFEECRLLVAIHLLNASVGESGLRVFRDHTQIEELVLDGAPMTDVSLAFFSACRNLRVLSIRNTPLTDAAPGFLKEPKHLTHIQVSDTNIGDKGLADISDSKELIRLAANGLQITDETLARFATNPALREVELARTAITSAGLVHFQKLNGLRFLDLQKTAVADAGIEHLKSVPLDHLDLTDTKVTDEVIATLGQMSTLQRLFLTRTKVTPAGVKTLADKLPRCRIVHDGGVIEPIDPDRKAAEWITSVGGSVRVSGIDRDIGAVGDLPRELFRVTRIALNRNNQVTDEKLALFKECKNVTSLALDGTNVTDMGLVNFKDHTNLTHIWIEDTPVTGTGLANFQNCKQLVQLSVGKTAMTDAGLAHFKDCERLSILTLGGTHVTDDGLSLFKNFKPLWHLQLQDTAVTDAGLEHLKECRNLQSLILSGTAITDTGLMSLAGLDKLTDLRLGKTKVTKAGVEKLAAARPACKIEWDGGTIEPKK